MSLKVWLPLNGDLENRGISNLSNFSYNTFTQRTDGKIGGCYSGQGIYHISEELIQNSWSLCAWVKSSSWSVNNDIILCKNTTASDNCQFYFSIINGATLNLGINAGSSSTSFSYAFSTNTWYHVAATYNGSVYTLYINGEQKKTGTITNALKTGMNNIGINCRSTNAAGTSQTGDNGKRLNDVRIYDHCLSAAEVHEISQGLILHYKLDQPNPNILSEGVFDVDPWKSAISAHEVYYGRLAYRVANNTLYQKTSSGVNDVFAGTISYEANTQYTLSVTWRDDYRTDNKNSSLYLRFNYTDGSSVTNMISPANTVHEWVHQSITSNAGKTVSKITTTYGNGGQLYLTDLKLEKGTIDTGVSITNSNVIIDSSGYNNNGQIVDGTFMKDTPRYDNAINLQGTTVDSSSNVLTGAQFFYCNMDMPATDKLTIAWWGKNLAYGRGGIFETSNIVQTDTTKGTDYNTTAIANWDSTFGIYNGSSRVNIFSNFNKNGDWHHHAITFDGTNVKYYCDSELKQTSALTGTLPAWKSFCMGLGKAGGVWRQIKQYVSDLRIYATPLLDNDIKSLYNIGMKIDNQNNAHPFEINESNTNKLTKSGILFDQIIEPYLTLSDGSKWKLMLCHYVDNGRNLFTSSNATYCNELGLYSRLNEIANYSYDNKYEYYVIQDGKEFRWTQTSSPIATSISGLTTVSGYLNPVNGLAKPTSLTQTYIGYSSWWGACGCWTSYSTGGKTGIPGFGSHDANGICENYLALYTRISNIQFKLKDELVEAVEFIER